jgi:hypothetical protein
LHTPAQTALNECPQEPHDIEDARKAIAEQVGQLTLEASSELRKRLYLPHGKVDFFAEEEMARSNGAGGPDWTVRFFEFCLPIAA